MDDSKEQLTTSTSTTKKNDLFDDDDDSVGDDNNDSNNDNNPINIKINQKYAAQFLHRKQQEELRKNRNNIKLFDKKDGGDDDDDSASTSTSSEEDEDGNLLSTRVDVDIMKTINALRTKDSSIYDPNVTFFDRNDQDDDGDHDSNSSSDDHAKKKNKKKKKPMRYKDVIREKILEKMEKDNNDDGDDSSDIDDDEDDDMKNNNDRSTKYDDGNHNKDIKSRYAYNEEQENLRQALLSNVETNSSDKDDDNDDDILVLKKKVRDQDDNDEDAVHARHELEMELQKLKENKNHNQLVDPRGEITDGEEFLLNFFKNRSWKLAKDDDEGASDDDDSDHSENSNDEEMQMKTPKEDKNDYDDDDISLDELEKADEFEAKYNFRFEDAVETSGANLSLQSYARGKPTSSLLRRIDTTRKEKRKAREERKAEERKAIEEELKRLKNIKRQMMQEKIQKVKDVLGIVEENGGGSGDDMGSGIDEAALMKLMEGDYDPNEFEALMSQMYNDEYYEQEEKQWKNDKDVRETLKQAAQLGNDIDDTPAEHIDETLYDDDEEDQGYDEVHKEGGEDQEYIDQEEEWYADEDYNEEEGYQEQEEEDDPEIIKKLKNKMADELDRLDYEDIVAGMPTRFKYKQVEPNAYGLTTADILLARDTTLRQYVSLKRLAPYHDKTQEYKVSYRKRKRFHELIKKDIEEQQDLIEFHGGGSKSKNNKESKEEKTQKDEDRKAENDIEEKEKKKRRRRLKKKKNDDGNAEKANSKTIELAESKGDKIENKSNEKKLESSNVTSTLEPSENQVTKKKRNRRKKGNSDSSGTSDNHKAMLQNEKDSSVGSRNTTRNESTAPSQKLHNASNQNDLDNKTEGEMNQRKDRNQDKTKTLEISQHLLSINHATKLIKKKEQKKPQKSSVKVDGISHSRLASYGL